MVLQKIYFYLFLLFEHRTPWCRTRAREIDKCKSVQPFHKQSAISVSFMETTNRPFPHSRKLPIGSFRTHGNCRSAVSVTIGRFLIYSKECILTLNSIIFPSYTLFLVIFGFKKKKRYRILVTYDGK